MDQQVDAGLEAILQPVQSSVPAQEQAQPAAPVQPEPARQTPTVPLPELLETRHRAQLAEQKAAFLEQQMAQFQQAFEAQQRQAAPPIDPISDPVGAHQAVVHQMHEQAIHQRANMSEMIARGKHGDQAVDAAIQAAIQSGLNRHFMAQPDPYRALLDWNNTNRVAKEVGTDLDAFRKRVAAEEQAKLLAQMKTGQPPPQNLPPSLATAANAGANQSLVRDTSDFFRSELFAKRRTT